MSAVDLHPEDLLDRVRRGQATAAERERVAQHLQGCEACRFEHALLAQSARDAVPHAGDDARARRLALAAAQALSERGLLAPRPTARGGRVSRGRRAGALLAAGIVSSLATAAAAAVVTQPAWLRDWVPALADSEQPAAPARPQRATRVRKPRVETAERAPSPPDRHSATQAPVTAVPPPRAPTRSAGTRPGATRSAAELFAAANLARREREPAAAVRLYRELERVHPRSDEAQVARVALGRLLLDRVGDARGALREFEAYLAAPGARALREDALIGKALALGRLGRAREEHAAWKVLLAAHPASGYAERARARLQALRCAVEPC